MSDRIVNFTNGSQYFILNETNFNDKRYCCAVEYYSNIDDIGDKLVVFEQTIQNDDIVLNIVDDMELINYIMAKIIVENDR